MKELNKTSAMVETLHELAMLADYSLMDTLSANPEATSDGVDYSPREVFSGHYVPVNPTPIQEPHYIAHSTTFFKELGLDDSLATSEDFIRMFSGDTSQLPEPLRRLGWATGYALSIYGSEYYEQCPFGTGNAYGDGRAISILEAVINGQRWEMQLKGGGRTPYCRGADGRAVLRSSIREFLAQEHMHALGVPTSRSLSLYTSKTETVRRPWFTNGSYSRDPEVMIEEAVAITTRVAPSFIRVGQLELFGRRARKNEHPKAMEELEKIVLHLIDREYSDVIDESLPIQEKVIFLAREFGSRLSSLVANWIRVGYCQGNFNSDNCAAGGFTLDYGPFGFIDMFDPRYQPWTGGGVHFSFLNQPQAAERNFHMFCMALKPLLKSNKDALDQLDKIREDFPQVMQEQMIKMWASKLGLKTFNASLFNELLTLMIETSVDYTIFFRELSTVPEDIFPLTKSFYGDSILNENIIKRWSEWLEKWKSLIHTTNPADINATSEESREKLSTKMKAINPKYTLREWFLVPAYQQATSGDYTLIKELQKIMTNPYTEQSKEIEEKYYRVKPSEFFKIAGISHVSCSS
ncbi:protein adenylyltransferase SelO family protein [Sulfurovum sp. zt1-1]|uniref:Protein nucleotidyltransferase YdiU n=1 Tax=Sulfurovum zhangzhouensis TaxID=3019067 RepID=A0ABT7QXP6_9BACT|nr:protein adenylyltransferase SelO family protein [Sulfurovum zhangzhouensis]MDM5271607.1 protein adenylyltransferase SelO family protein [Sulfurovum zhangzhouensis]